MQHGGTRKHIVMAASLKIFMALMLASVVKVYTHGFLNISSSSSSYGGRPPGDRPGQSTGFCPSAARPLQSEPAPKARSPSRTGRSPERSVSYGVERVESRRSVPNESGFAENTIAASTVFSLVLRGGRSAGPNTFRRASLSVRIDPTGNALLPSDIWVGRFTECARVLSSRESFARRYAFTSRLTIAFEYVKQYYPTTPEHIK